MGRGAVRGGAELVSDTLPRDAYDQLAGEIWGIGKLISPHLFTMPMAPSTINTGYHRPCVQDLDVYRIAQLDFDAPESDMAQFAQLDDEARAQIIARIEDDESESFTPSWPELGPLAVEVSIDFRVNKLAAPEPNRYAATVYEIEPYDWRPPHTESGDDEYEVWQGSELYVWRCFELHARKRRRERIAFSRGVTIWTRTGSIDVHDRLPEGDAEADHSTWKMARELAQRPMRDDYERFLDDLAMLAHSL